MSSLPPICVTIRLTRQDGNSVSDAAVAVGGEEKLHSFPPLLPSVPDARIMILGSMPGVQSLQASQYYAHPRNQFWPIIEAIFSIPRDLPYLHRCKRLAAKGVVLWDVIAQCERDGSLDSAIRPQTLEVNDFVALFQRYPQLIKIFFNGTKAEDVFNKRVLPTLDPELVSRLERVRLPSSSPAYAALTFEQKLAMWRDVIDVGSAG